MTNLPQVFDPVAVCKALGFDAAQVRSVSMDPSECLVELVVCDRTGAPVFHAGELLTTVLKLRRGCA